MTLTGADVLELLDPADPASLPGWKAIDFRVIGR